MKKFHQMGGFSTSDHSRAKLQSVHLQYNALADHTDAVLNDRTRSKGEKSPMLAKAKTQIQSLLNKVEDARAEAQGRQDSVLESLQNKIDSVSMADALTITKFVSELDSIGRVSAMKESADIALAVMRVPKGIAGPLRDAAWPELIHTHMPETGEALATAEQDLFEIADAADFINKQADALEVHIDRDALATRI